MVYVRLERDWTDGDGTAHRAGGMVDVDAGTLAELEADGTVAEPDDAGWAGPTGGGGGASPQDAGWAGPTGGGGSGS